MHDGVKSDIGRNIFDDTSGTIVLIDTPERIRKMEEIIAKAELPTIERQLPTVTRVFNLRYADTTEILSKVQPALTKEVGTVTANIERRALIVTDLPHAIDKIDKMIEVFDQKPKQVAILAKVVEVNLNDQFSLGVDWKHVLNRMSPRYSLESAVPMTAASLGANQQSPPTLTYKTIAAGGDLEAIVDAMKSIGETKIISNPYISVLDGHEASIQVVENQPYKEIAYEPGTTNVVGVTFSFVDIGTTLSVSPRITDNDFITVDIKPTISSISEWYAGRPQEGTPVVKKSEAQTTVVVRDNVTIIIGGMIKTRNEQRVNGVPLISSIPLLGNLFKSTAEQQIKTETIVFLTPRIITGDEPFLQRPDLEKQPKFRMRRHQSSAARHGRPVLKTRGTDKDPETEGN
jgi:type II secretory pathway component GspD/PulD (secretin)